MNYKIKFIMIISLIIILSFSITISAEDIVSEEDGEFDFSEYEEELDKLGILTMDKIENIKNEAISLFEDENYEKAEKKLERWAEASNVMSNIIAEGLEPFYSARRSEREEIGITKIRALSGYETKVNDLRKNRNLAFVKRAESLKEIGRKEEALALYREVLGLIEIDNWDLWIRAANGLYGIIDIPLIED